MQVYDANDNNANVQFLPNPKLHYIISLVKSGIRILGAMTVAILAFFSGELMLGWLATTICVAECVGVVEEMV